MVVMKRIHALVVVGVVLVAATGGWRAWRDYEEPAARRHIRAAEALEKRGDLHGAAREWQIAVALEPGRVEAHEGLAAAYLREGAMALAVREFRAVIALDPRREHAYCRLSEACMGGGLAEPAYRAARYAAQIEPKCPLAHTVYGLLLADRQDTRAAIKELNIAAALAPKDTRPRAVLARLYMGVGQWEEAEKHARAAHASSAGDPALNSLLAGILVETAQPEKLAEAAQLLQQTVDDHADDPDAWAELGRVHRRRGDMPAARRALEKALKLFPRHRVAVAEMADVCAALGNQSRAAELERQEKLLAKDDVRRRELLELLTHGHADGAALMELGNLFARDGDYAQAADYLQRAADALNGEPRVMARLIEVRALARNGASTHAH